MNVHNIFSFESSALNAQAHAEKDTERKTTTLPEHIGESIKKIEDLIEKIEISNNRHKIFEHAESTMNISGKEIHKLQSPSIPPQSGENYLIKLPKLLLKKEIMDRLDQQDLINFALTSKESFLDTLNEYPKISLMSYGQSGLIRFKILAKTHGDRLTTLNLQDIDLKTFNLATLIQKCPNVTSITDTGDENFSDKDVITLSNLKRLHTFYVFGCKNSIDCNKITDVGWAALGTNAKNLHTLHVSCSNQITDTSVEAISIHVIHLHTLRFFSCMNITDKGLEAISIHAKNLHTLDLSYCNKITDTGVKAISTNAIHLHTFRLFSCYEITDTGMEVLSANTKNLRTLHLSYCKKITDTGVEAISIHAKNLHTLDLSHCHQITDAGLTALSKNAKNLHTLILRGWSKITPQGKKLFGPNCKIID